MLLALAVAAVVAGRALFAENGLTTAPDDEEARVAAQMLAALPAATPAPVDQPPRGADPATLRDAAPRLAPQRPHTTAPGAVLTSAPFEAAEPATGTYTRLDGTAVGFRQVALPPLHSTVQLSANEFAPLAAGDVNDDGWPDVAVGTSQGALLYVNVGGRFELAEVDFAPMRAWTITYLALVDLDGSASPDLFLCAWLEGCHVLFNHDGVFSAAAHTELPRAEELATHSAAFADVDRDGHVDVVTGPAVGLGWKFAPYGRLRLWYSDGGGQFRPQELEGPSGETLSLLFHDVDGDGWTDLYAGNDFDEPDLVYRNDGGRLRLLTKEDSPFPHTTESTMSVDSGDLDNDGLAEVYQAAIAYGGVGLEAEDRPRWSPHDSCRQGFSDPTEVRRCLELGDFQTAVVRSRDITDVTECRHYDDADRQRQCIAAGYLWNEAFVDVPEQGGTVAAVVDVCRKMPPDLDRLVEVCAAAPKATLDHGHAAKVHTDHMPQIRDWNVLFTPAGGGYEEVTERWGAAFGGWSWNAKFADVDNDTWQDLYVTQGTRLRFSNVSNLLYHNQAGGGFVDAAERLGLRSHVPTGASLFVDYNLDGRLDIITHPFGLTPQVWRNDAAAHDAVVLALRDETSPNTAAIGARVELLSADARLQVREIKASGGFESDDWKVAWFGLGDWPGVESVVVTWPDQTKTVLATDDLEPGRYTLTRTR